MMGELRRWRRYLHANPELSVQERLTVDYLADQMQALGLNGSAASAALLGSSQTWRADRTGRRDTRRHGRPTGGGYRPVIRLQQSRA